MGRIHSRGLCPPCRARHRLDELFATASDQLAVELGPLREHLASYPNPYGLIGYLTGTRGRLIHRLLTGELRCTHDDLDQLRQTGAVTRLRGPLIAAGLLPSREENLIRVHARAQALLDDVNETASWSAPCRTPTCSPEGSQASHSPPTACHVD
jgi:hypothetical protein